MLKFFYENKIVSTLFLIQLHSGAVDDRAVLLPYQTLPIVDLFDEQLIIRDNSTARRRRASSSSVTKVPLVQPRKLLNQSASLDMEAVLLKIGDGQVCKICYHTDNNVSGISAIFP